MALEFCEINVCQVFHGNRLWFRVGRGEVAPLFTVNTLGVKHFVVYQGLPVVSEIYILDIKGVIGVSLTCEMVRNVTF